MRKLITKLLLIVLILGNILTSYPIDAAIESTTSDVTTGTKQEQTTDANQTNSESSLAQKESSDAVQFSTASVTEISDDDVENGRYNSYLLHRSSIEIT